MRLSKKTQYALKAVLELARNDNGQPLKIQQVASSQNIPPRFLEVILNQLRHAGFVESRRGSEGGYMLACQGGDLTVGDIIRSTQGPVPITVDCAGCFGEHAFTHLWRDVSCAVESIYNNTTFAQLIKIERDARAVSPLNYSI